MVLQTASERDVRKMQSHEQSLEKDLAEERAEILRSLAYLTYKQRASVVLLDLLGMTSDEAAAALGMSAGAVRTQASRGRAAIRRRKGADDG